MKKIICVVCIMLAFVLGACSTTMVYAEQTRPLKIWKENRNGQMETWKIIDENTGVNYIVVAPKYTDSSGNSYDAVAITPRFNADGTLYVTG